MGQGDMVFTAEFNSTPSYTSVTLPDTGGAAGRGSIVSLGRAVGVNLNSAASTTIFTSPAAGITRCVVLFVIVDNYSTAATTASVQFGSGVSADWAATAVNANAATAHFLLLTPTATLAPTYGTGVVFAATVTIVQGVAATADIRAMGYYE